MRNATCVFHLIYRTNRNGKKIIPSFSIISVLNWLLKEKEIFFVIVIGSIIKLSYGIINVVLLDLVLILSSFLQKVFLVTTFVVVFVAFHFILIINCFNLVFVLFLFPQYQVNYSINFS